MRHMADIIVSECQVLQSIINYWLINFVVTLQKIGEVKTLVTTGFIFTREVYGKKSI